jgi:hypothetical protein
MKESSLSMNAKNVKIIARDGNITLKGPVDSQQEKDTIGTKSGEVAGKDKSISSLESKRKKSNRMILLQDSQLNPNTERYILLKASALSLVDTKSQADAVVGAGALYLYTFYH